jgi:hypothetical protein
MIATFFAPALRNLVAPSQTSLPIQENACILRSKSRMAAQDIVFYREDNADGA